MFGKLFKRNVPGAFSAEMLDAFDRKFRDFYGTNILLRSGFLSYLTSTFSDSDRPKEGTVGYCYIQWPWYGAAIKMFYLIDDALRSHRGPQLSARQ